MFWEECVEISCTKDVKYMQQMLGIRCARNCISLRLDNRKEILDAHSGYCRCWCSDVRARGLDLC